MRHLIRSHPAASFVALAFAFSYTVGVATLWLAGAAIGFSRIGVHYIGRIGVVFGPAVAALIVTYFAGGRDGINRLLSRLAIRREVLTWVAVIPVLGFAVTFVACLTTGTSTTILASAITNGWKLLLAHYLLAVVTAGIGEELGWRGWFLPHLLARHRRVDATLLVAVVWCVWHLPALLSGGSVALALAVMVLALSFLFTGLWSYTGGSVLIVAIAHASVNAPINFWEAALGYEGARSAWVVTCGSYAVTAILFLAARWSWWRGISSDTIASRINHERVHGRDQDRAGTA